MEWHSNVDWPLKGTRGTRKQHFRKNNEIYSPTFSRNCRVSIGVWRGMEVESWSGTVCGNTVWGVRLEWYGVVVCEEGWVYVSEARRMSDWIFFVAFFAKNGTSFLSSFTKHSQNLF
jgi:hypothetical protein